MRIFEVFIRSPAVIVFSILPFFLASHALARPFLLLSTFAGPPLSNNTQAGYYDLIMKEAFGRAGITIEIAHLPAERSLVNANQGITDGDFVRIAGLESLYPHLVRVPEKIDDFEFVAFSKNVSVSTRGWESLIPYDVAIVRGWKILEKNLVDSRHLVRVKDQDLLFTLLEKDRTDIVVYSRFEGYEMIRQLGMKNVHVLEPPLEVREMYLYLNEKHRSLVPEIAKHLKEMKREGLFDSIKDKTLSPFLSGKDYDAKP